METHAVARKASLSKGDRYNAPRGVVRTTLSATLAKIGQPSLNQGQISFLDKDQSKSDTHLFYVGNLDLLKLPSVAVVGAREVSEEGAARARRLSRELAEAGVTVVSGLAKGVDVNAHSAAIEAGGKTVAVIGTPIDRVYPSEHRQLQETIAHGHLLVSPFEPGTTVYPSNFPKRNRVMAALTSGSVIIEASDSSGTLHQAVECEKLGRWLFILKSVFDRPDIEWPKRYAQYEKVRIVSSAADVLGALEL